MLAQMASFPVPASKEHFGKERPSSNHLGGGHKALVLSYKLKELVIKIDYYISRRGSML
jgi:hypothetical protein